MESNENRGVERGEKALDRRVVRKRKARGESSGPHNDNGTKFFGQVREPF